MRMQRIVPAMLGLLVLGVIAWPLVFGQEDERPPRRERGSERGGERGMMGGPQMMRPGSQATIQMDATHLYLYAEGTLFKIEKASLAIQAKLDLSSELKKMRPGPRGGDEKGGRDMDRDRDRPDRERDRPDREKEPK